MNRATSSGSESSPGPEPMSVPGLSWLHTSAFAVVVFVGLAVWSLASPLMSVPDEPAHAVKAASVWQGQLRGRSGDIDGIPVDRVRVPETFAKLSEIPPCYVFYPPNSAACAPGVTASGRIVESTTTAGPYPPLYYALVGWPSAVTASGTGVRLMRLTSALVCALLVALAARSLSRVVAAPLAVTAVVLTVTPTTYFISAGINPAGQEIAAAILFWCAGAALTTSWTRERALDRWQVAEVLIGFAFLALTRTLGLLFAGLAVVFVAAYAGRSRLRDLLSDRRAWWLAAPAVVITAVAGSWVLVNGHLDAVPGAPLGPDDRPLVYLGGVTDDFLRQMVAIFGWKDTGPVTQSVMPWLAATAAFISIGFLLTGTWRRLVLAACVAAVVALPVLMQLDTLERDGFAWQGRYLLPFAVGVPVLSALASSSAPAALRSGLRSVCTSITLLCAVGLTAGLWVWLHRVSVGIDGKALNPLHWGQWNPPIPAWALIATMAVIALVPVLYVSLSPELRVGSVDPADGVIDGDGPRPGSGDPGALAA